MKTYRLHSKLNNIEVLSIENYNKIYLFNNDTYTKTVKIIDTTHSGRMSEEYIIKPKELKETKFNVTTFIIDVEGQIKECDGRGNKIHINKNNAVEILCNVIADILDAI